MISSLLRFFTPLLCGLSLCLLCTEGARAGELEVVVVDEKGEALSGVPVIVRTAPRAGTRSRLVFGAHHGVSDRTGVVALVGLPPGMYEVDAGAVSRWDLVRPSENPYAPPPRVLIEEAAPRKRVELVLWKGTDVTVDTEVLGWELFSGTARFLHRDSGWLVEGRLGAGTAMTRVLPPGRFVVSLEPPSGLLLTRAQHNGRDLAQASTVLDLDVETYSHHLSYTFEAQGVLRAEVTLRDPSQGTSPLRIEATLIEPGEWAEDALARAGSRMNPVVRHYRWIPLGIEMPLAAGRYRVRPVSERPLESFPEQIEVEMAPGDDKRVTFEVEFGSEADSLRVSVADEDGRDLSDAEIEARLAAAPQEVLGRARTGEAFAPAQLFGLPEGEVLELQVDHPQYLSATKQVIYQPDREFHRPGSEGRPATTDRVRVTLERGASVELLAVDLEGRPLSGVELWATRRSDDPESEAFERGARTDTRGEATLGGLLAGDYDLEAEFQGSDRALGHIGLEIGGKVYAEHPVLVRLDRDEVLPVVATLLPAASLRMQLRCTNGDSVPGTADVRVFRAVAHLTDVVSETRRDDEPDLELERRALSGSARDQLIVGPLDPGAFEIAVRPEGFDRYTWAFETHNRDTATAVQITRAEAQSAAMLELGELLIECDPGAELVLPEPADPDTKRPSLESGLVKLRLYDRELLPSEAENPTPAGAELRSPQFQTTARGLLLERIQPGSTRLVVEILTDGEPERYQIDLDLERGAFKRYVLARRASDHEHEGPPR